MLDLSREATEWSWSHAIPSVLSQSQIHPLHSPVAFPGPPFQCSMRHCWHLVPEASDTVLQALEFLKKVVLMTIGVLGDQIDYALTMKGQGEQ